HDPKKVADRYVYLRETTSMLAEVSGGPEIEGTEGAESRSEAGAEFLASTLFVIRERVEPRFHAVIGIMSETALQYLWDAAGRREESIEIGVKGSLPAGVENRARSFQCDVVVSSFRWLD